MDVIGETRKRNSGSSNYTTALLLRKIDAGKDSKASQTLQSTKTNNTTDQILISTFFDANTVKEVILLPLDEGKMRLLASVPLLSTEPERSFLENKTVEIFHASLELLNQSKVYGKYFALLTIVHRRRNYNILKIKEESFSGTIFLVESLNDSLVQSSVVEKVNIVQPQPRPIHLHLLPTQPGGHSSDEEESSTSSSSSAQLVNFKNQLIVLSLGECIAVHRIETTPFSNSKTKIEIILSVRVTKNVWWAEFNVEHQFLAFAYNQKRTHSVFLEEEGKEEDSLSGESSNTQTQSILSVFQFHQQFQRETVLNFPLESMVVDENEKLQCCSMISSPKILSVNNPISSSLRLLTHSTGSVSLFYLKTPDSSFLLSYNVNLLHHNKTLIVNVPDESFKGVNRDILRVDVCLCRKDEYLVVLAWPYILHILDIGIGHEPSHHFVFSLDILFPGLTKRVESNSCFKLLCPKLTNEDSVLHLVFADLTVQSLEFSSSFFLSALRKSNTSHGSDVNLTLATIHSLLLHFKAPHAVKRLIGEMSRRVQNLHLTKIFKEFIIAYAYSAIIKDLLPNMETFLHFIPYCPIPPQQNGEHAIHYNGKTYLMKLQNNSSKVSTMLLSPSQRISFDVTDIWTSLWEGNALLTTSRRFSHKTIADKLLLSLQCYKPEALSRASTPMSPSSPMVCGSLGDIVSMFSRRTQELQLPFVEHESCTANKQEYIFSINLRELSMHLLKERRDWPLACHTVAGKYVNALTDASRLLCHLISLTTITQLERPLRPKDKGFTLIDSMTSERQLSLFILMEHFALAHGTLACPLPHGFTPFFAYLGYRVLRFEQFLWHVRCGTFDLQIDMVKTIMSDLNDSDDKDVEKKLQLISFLPKSRANRVLNGWSHPIAIGLRARQHASDLLSGTVTSQSRKSHFSTQVNRVKSKVSAEGRSTKHSQGPSALDTFFRLLTAKANAADIDLGLLTEATMLSMK